MQKIGGTELCGFIFCLERPLKKTPETTDIMSETKDFLHSLNSLLFKVFLPYLGVPMLCSHSVSHSFTQAILSSVFLLSVSLQPVALIAYHPCSTFCKTPFPVMGVQIVCTSCHPGSCYLSIISYFQSSWVCKCLWAVFLGGSWLLVSGVGTLSLVRRACYTLTGSSNPHSTFNWQGTAVSYSILISPTSNNYSMF